MCLDLGRGAPEKLCECFDGMTTIEREVATTKSLIWMYLRRRGKVLGGMKGKRKEGK